MNKKKKTILFLIILIAAILRFFQLSRYPVGFHIDEASLGYNAYSILKTGRDENGMFLPLHTDMFGDFRPAGYQYLDILPVKFFGLNEWATRLPSAFLGILAIWAIFLLAEMIFGGSLPALLAAALLAISPWHVMFSRVAAETNASLTFVIFGAYFFISGVTRQKGKHYFYSIVAWSLSLFTYPTPRVFVPLLGLALIGLLLPFWFKKRRIVSWRPLIIVSLITIISLFFIFGTRGGTGRFRQVSIFHFPEVRLVLEEQIREDGVAGLSPFLVRAFHNKIVNYGLGYLNEYFRYFSPNYLFIEGGLPRWYQIPRVGLVYIIELPFILIGSYQLFKKGIEKEIFLVPLAWLVLGPVVAAMTIDDVPNVQRSLVMLSALVLISAYGWWFSWQWAKTKLNCRIFKLLFLGIVVFFAWNFSYFLHQYFVHGRLHRTWYRFNGFKEMVLAVDQMLPNYDRVVVTKSQGGVYMHFLFYQQFDPQAYQQLGSPKDKDYQGFGRLIFVPESCPTALPSTLSGKTNQNVIYVASGICESPPFSEPEAKLIKREDGTVAFRIAVSKGRNE